MTNFVTLENLVSSVLLEIGDEGNKRYLIKARQWILDEYRRVNTHFSDIYLERKVSLDNNNSCDIPEESVKLITVGMYRNGVFEPFVKLPDMEIRAEDQIDGIFNLETTVTSTNNTARGAYWKEDRSSGRFFVKNYQTIQRTPTDTTQNIAERIIIRYRTTGLNLGGDVFIPYEAKDYLVAAVAYKFAKKSIPVRLTNMALQQEAIQVDAYKSDYTALLYEPGSFYEVRDTIFGRI